jgi:predicted transcriptional regulator
MAEAKELDFNQSHSVSDEEDQATLEAIDRGVRAANEGRVVSSEEARQRVKEWLTRSSTPKTR